ncbi:MAG: bifunctional DNA primase/polymerase [Candidatus Verstraetearchaeota archaeon]|nr:bifunctional DNA primase/polymerase [Candidatus Verstraetearchaeota archaeon]
MSIRDVEVLGLRLYNSGFNVIPVNSEKRPFSTWSCEKRIEEGEFKKLLSKAQGIGIAAGPIHPFGEKYDLLIVDVDKPSFLAKTPFLEYKISQTVHWFTGPRCPKCEAKKIDKEIEVLELGKRFKCKKCKIEFTLEEAKRGLGAIFLVDRGAFSDSRRSGGVEFLIRNYQVIPPSIHPSGVYYSWVNPIDFTKKNFGIAYLDDKDLKAILNECAEAELHPEIEHEEEDLEVEAEEEPKAPAAASIEEKRVQVPQTANAFPKKCPFCKKYHTIKCPAENEESIRTGVFFQGEDSEPVREDCFEPDLGRMRPFPTSPATEISETFSYTGDRPFRGRVQVGALTTPSSRFTTIVFQCRVEDCRIGDCPLAGGLTLSVNGEGGFDPSAFATYFDTNNPMNALYVYAEKYSFNRCAEWRRKIAYTGSDERAVTGAIIYDLTGREGRAWFIHGEKCDLRRAPNWIIAEGWLCRGYKGRIGVLIQAFKGESEVIAPPPEEVEKARAILKKLVVDGGLEGSAVWRLAELLRRKVNAKGGEVRKGFVADLLLVAGPVWVKTPENADRELGPTICELGPSTNYKSQRGRFLVEWIGAGKYLRGRKTEAGLTAGLEKIEGLGWVAKKGALPSADLSFIIVDNAPPHALDEQIESRRDGIVSVAGIKSMELWARTRLKLLNNPLQPLEELVYKCVALKMFDSKLIARMTFAIYTYGISVDERYDPTISSLTAEEEAILEAARTVLRWNLSQEVTYTVPLSLWPKIMEYSKQLELKYGCEDIPLLLRNIPYKLAVLAYSFAILEGEAEPSERHYRLAYEWLDYCARDIELDKYAEVQRTLRNLSDEEYEKIRKAIEEEIERDINAYGGEREDSHIYRFLEYLVKHGTSRCDELAAYLEVDEKTVKRKAQLLKGLGLLRSGKDGYTYTPKGVRFIKRWITPVPDVPDATTFKGQRQPGEEDLKIYLTPKNGDNEDIEDKEKNNNNPKQRVGEEYG